MRNKGELLRIINGEDIGTLVTRAPASAADA
jgi:hypothetical protein